jgi:chemotaxis methyl-accepting protein methylase
MSTVVSRNSRLETRNPKLETNPVEDKAALKKLEEALAEHYGWAMHTSTREKVATAIARKAARLHVPTDQYCLLASSGSSELLSLVEEIAVSETFFFREPQQYEFLRTTVVPELFAKHAASEAFSRDHRLRLWSAACSTGEEAFSLAITCHQVNPKADPSNVEVFATDVRNRALLEASRARYQPPALRMCDAALRATYFENYYNPPEAPLDSRHTVVSNVRRLVIFRRANLMDGMFWKGVSNRFELILCANVPMYLHSVALRQMIERLSRSLRAGGYLMVAPAETSLIEHARLKRVPACEGFFQKQ